MAPKTFAAGHELNGQYLLGLIGSINEKAVKPYRVKHGLEHIDPDGWYSMQQVHNFFEDLENSPNSMFNLVAVGMQLGKQFPFPPEVTTVEDAFAIINEMSHKGIRGGDTILVETNFLNDRHLVLTVFGFPGSANLAYGIYYGIVKRFVPMGSDVVVEQETVGDTLQYNIRW